MRLRRSVSAIARLTCSKTRRASGARTSIDQPRAPPPMRPGYPPSLANTRGGREAGRVGLDWRDREVSADEAVSAVSPGDRVFIGSACATPWRLVEALGRL